MRYPFNEPTTFIGWRRVLQIAIPTLVVVGLMGLLVALDVSTMVLGVTIILSSAGLGHWAFSLDRQDGRAHDCDHECAERHLRDGTD